MNPEPPIYVSTLGVSKGIYVEGNYAFVADGDEGLAIIDISNPNTPVYVTSVNTTGDSRNLIVEGDYVYLADYDQGLQIFDISDPQNPSAPFGAL